MLQQWSARTDGTAAFRVLSRPRRRFQLGARSTTRNATGTSTSPRDDHKSHTHSHPAGPLPPPTQTQDSPPLLDFDALRSRFKDWHALASSSLRQHADQFSKKATASFSQLGPHLNQVTGYDEIEALKLKVVAQEARIRDARRTAREAKTAYDLAVLQRSVSQRRVNDLLQRKSTWTDTDVSDFTSLIRSDHSLEQEESRAKAGVTASEDAVEREFTELMRVILARYHEEQVWSDKIRSASTYGSLAVLGVNLLVFIMAILVVEPWKRRRLAQTFEKKVEEMEAETKALIDAGAARLEERLIVHEKLLTEVITQVSVEAPQGSFVTATSTKEASSEQTPVALTPDPSWWSQVILSYPHLGAAGGRELILVVGSAAAGGVITLLARSLLAR